MQQSMQFAYWAQHVTAACFYASCADCPYTQLSCTLVLLCGGGQWNGGGQNKDK